MSFLDTQPAPIDSDGHDDPFAQFRSSHPREVLALLRELRDGGTPVALSSPGGTGLGATVWTVDPDRGRIAPRPGGSGRAERARHHAGGNG